MKMLKVLTACVMLLAGSALLAPGATGNEIGYEGCTPGYWKNHTDSWPEPRQVSPSATLSSIYPGLDAGALAVIGGTTTLQALQGNGQNPLPNGYAQLGRAATAAWLNAATEQLGYPWRRGTTGLDGRPPLVETVVAAFNSGDLNQMKSLASRLDGDNNLGCSLS
jgi:hypothetical protein